MSRTLENGINDIANRHGLAVRQVGDGWCLELPARGRFDAKLDIGPEALEWYLTVSSQGYEVWTDWMDYQRYSDTTTAQLVNDKVRDLTWFVEAWISASDVRTSKRGTWPPLKETACFEWEREGIWQALQIFEPGR